MIRPGRNRRAPGRRRAFAPTDIGGLVLWLDNSLITQAAGKVTAWPDLSGAGNHFAQTNPSLQPNYVASETDFPTSQPAVKFDVGGYVLDGPAGTPAAVAWFAFVAVYPATTFSDFNTLLTDSAHTAGNVLMRGASGTANWRVVDETAGTRYRDGVATNVALTTANTPHLYEFVPTVPYTPPNAFALGTEPGSPGRIWRDSVGLVLMATAVPDAPTRAALLAYCQGRGMIP